VLRQKEFPPEGRYQLGKNIQKNRQKKVKRADAFNDREGVS
jgi:hypothetical protein